MAEDGTTGTNTGVRWWVGLWLGMLVLVGLVAWAAVPRGGQGEVTVRPTTSAPVTVPQAEEGIGPEPEHVYPGSVERVIPRPDTLEGWPRERAHGRVVDGEDQGIAGAIVRSVSGRGWNMSRPLLKEELGAIVSVSRTDADGRFSLQLLADHGLHAAVWAQPDESRRLAAWLDLPEEPPLVEYGRSSAGKPEFEIEIASLEIDVEVRRPDGEPAADASIEVLESEYRTPLWAGLWRQIATGPTDGDGRWSATVVPRQFAVLVARTDSFIGFSFPDSSSEKPEVIELVPAREVRVVVSGIGDDGVRMGAGDTLGPVDLPLGTSEHVVVTPADARHVPIFLQVERLGQLLMSREVSRNEPRTAALHVPPPREHVVRVLNRDGEPVTDATLVCTIKRDDLGTQWCPATVVDVRGEATLYGALDEGDSLEVEVWHTGTVVERATFTGPLDEASEIRVGSGRGLRGRVLDSDGRPVAGALVGQVYGASDAAFATGDALTRTDADGRYDVAVRFLDPDDESFGTKRLVGVVVEGHMKTVVDVSLGEGRTELDFTLPPE